MNRRTFLSLAPLILVPEPRRAYSFVRPVRCRDAHLLVYPGLNWTCNVERMWGPGGFGVNHSRRDDVRVGTVIYIGEFGQVMVRCRRTVRNRYEAQSMTALSRFARLLGLPAHQAEDALHSERAARAVLSRRSFFAASGAMVAGSAFSFPDARQLVDWMKPEPPVWIDVANGKRTSSWAPDRTVYRSYAGEYIPRGSCVVLGDDGLIYRAVVVDRTPMGGIPAILHSNGYAI